MTKSLSFVTSVVVATALALPAASYGQAGRRGGGESSGGSSSGGSSSGGSDSGSSAGPRSGPGTGGTAQPRSAPSSSEPSARSTPSQSRPSGGGTVTRDPSAAGQPQATRSGVIRRSPSGSNSPADSAALRVRGAQAARGVAQARPYPRGGEPTRGNNWPWWYSPSYGGYYGYYSGYSPWGYYGYRGSRYWGLYGADPFLYDPFGYYGYYGMTYPYYWTTYGTGSWRDEEPRERAATGSIRLKVNPKFAKVYVDGALAGTVDEFDGLSNHLELAPGPHQLELRAEGYQTYSGQIQVKRDRTSTERITLKRK